MRGIGDERLKELFNEHCSTGLISEERLQSECKDLNPWLPIKDAPKDRELLFKDKRGYRFIGQYDHMSDQYRSDCGYEIYPTHYTEIPK